MKKSDNKPSNPGLFPRLSEFIAFSISPIEISLSNSSISACKTSVESTTWLVVFE